MAAERDDNALRRPHEREAPPRRRAFSWRVLKEVFFGSCNCGRGDRRNEDVMNPNLTSTSDESQAIEMRRLKGLRKIKRRSSTMTVESSDNVEPKRGCCQRSKKKNSYESEEEVKTKKRIIAINSFQSVLFASNQTKTAKYTAWNFLPLFLFEQFRKLTNLFFLIMATLQQIPGVSPTGRYITLLPLLFILSVSAIKETVEDRKRHHADIENNKRKVEKLFGKEWKTIFWKDLGVGDFVRIHDMESFPADLLLLASSNSDGICFVETSNLDGETNLKVRKAIPETQHLTDAVELSQWRGTIECDPPNRRIYSFFGVLKRINERPAMFGANQILQRGAGLNGTKWIHGIVVYTGHETKLMKNYAHAPLKSSSIERLLNKQFFSLLALFFLVSLTSGGMYLTWIYRNASNHSYLGMQHQSIGAKEVIFNILTYLILYNNLIPISLTVTIEMVHFTQALFINSDNEMFDAETGTYAMARSSNLNGELGMVQYILTDKTGTLTCNIMKIKQCSIAGIIYDVDGELEESELMRNLLGGHPTVPIMEEFMLVISLCHSVISEIKDDGSIVYHATSPDDEEIIKFARRAGFEFVTRGTDYIEIRRFGRLERYTLLQIIEFSSSRKRMSVLIRMPAGNIKLFCKGADSIILERLSEDDERDYYSATREHLNMMASKGLRTLCCAVTDVPEELFLDWIEEYRRALTQFSNRRSGMEFLEDQIERNFTLLGVTAIEDKLQDGVPETIRFILAAQIKIWMLTGDKQETAINVAYASSLMDNSMQIVKLNETSPQDTFNALHSRALRRKRRHNNIALIIDGRTLEFALSKDVFSVFKHVVLKCRVVVCCRLSPMQKGKVTDLVNSVGVRTLAIGDGANDVTMIRRANVGVGISGVEGRQAASASDFSIAQFRYLKRLLFVHGTWNFHRLVKMIIYSFYKNILLCIMLMWYCFYNGWSAQILFDHWIIAAWNLVYTSWPPLAIGIFDKVCSEETLLKYPLLYGSVHSSKFLSVLIFWIWISIAIVHSVILFWLPLVFEGHDVLWKKGNDMDLVSFGNTIFTGAVIVVSLKAGLHIQSWNFVTHISIWGSIGAWFLTLLLYSYFWPKIRMGPGFSYSHYRIFTSLYIWLVVLIVVLVALLPDLYIKVLTNRFYPPLTLTAEMEYKRRLKRNRT